MQALLSTPIHVKQVESQILHSPVLIKTWPLLQDLQFFVVEPSHAKHGVEHALHLLSETSPNVPSRHLETHLLFSRKRGEVHERHFIGDSLQVLQLESQATQIFELVLYSLDLQVSHFVDVEEQVTQLESQGIHSLFEVSPNFPSGHWLIHLLLERKSGEVHERQPEELPSLHVLHEESQGRHLVLYK
jgi:hypothetical protein